MVTSQPRRSLFIGRRGKSGNGLPAVPWVRSFAKSNNTVNELKRGLKWGSTMRTMLSTAICLLSLCEGVGTAAFSALTFGSFLLTVWKEVSWVGTFYVQAAVCVFL